MIVRPCLRVRDVCTRVHGAGGRCSKRRSLMDGCVAKGRLWLTRLGVVPWLEFGLAPKSCVWWDFEDVILWEFILKGRAVDADLYFQQLEGVHDNLRRRHPALVNRKSVLLQLDNARPHTARTTMTKFHLCGGFELLPHPAYRPDFAPSDYHLFRSMAHFLRGRNFENIEAVEVCLTEFFALKTTDCYRRGIINLAERWLKTIESDDLCFEEYFKFLSENIPNYFF